MKFLGSLLKFTLTALSDCNCAISLKHSFFFSLNRTLLTFNYYSAVELLPVNILAAFDIFIIFSIDFDISVFAFKIKDVFRGTII